MKILTRYVLFELLQVFLLSLLGLTALIFVALVGREAVSKGLGLAPLMRMTPYILPQALQYAVPGTMLLAATNVYGRLSAFNEIVAAKSMGISPWALAKPAFGLAVLISLGAVVLNDLAVSWGRLGVQRVFVESIEGVIYNQLRLHRTYASGPLQINVRKVEGRRLIRPTLVVHNKSGDKPLKVTAASAELRSDPQRHKLVVVFDGIDIDGPLKIWNPSESTHEIGLEELVDDGGRSASSFSLFEIDDEKANAYQRLENLQWKSETGAAVAMMTGEFQRFTPAAMAYVERGLGALENHIRRLTIEPYRRWAGGFSCLCFVMIGVPMAILRQKGEFLASFFMCFLPILLVYYPLLMVSVDVAKSGTLPPIAVWIGNLVIAGWGFGMMRHVAAH